MLFGAALLLLAVQDPQDLVMTPPAWQSVQVHATVRATRIRLTTPVGPAEVRLDSLMLLYAIDTLRVLAASSDPSGHRVSVLLDMRGPSRGPESAMSMCGSGEERALVWLQVPLAATPQVRPYASCFLSREGELNANADSLWATVDDYPKKIRFHLTFRIQQADSGLRISQEPLSPP